MQQRDLKPYRILVIEDNIGDYTLIQDYLEEQFAVLQIAHATNCKDATNQLLNEQLSFDTILLDLTLPDQSGEELITTIISLAKEVPVIILTGYGDIDFSIRSLALGVTDYLIKDDINSSLLYKSIVYNIERRKINKELLDSQKRYRDLFNLSPQPKWLIDATTYRFIQVNQAAINLYGYTEEEFLKMTIYDIKAKEDHEALTFFLESHPKEETFSTRTKHLKKSNEVLIVDIYSSPFLIDDIVYRLIVVVDVTEKVLLENKITRAIIKTQEDERYEIGGELHDNVCQILAASLMSLRMMDHDVPIEKRDWYHNTEKYISLASEEIRNLSHQLAPAFFNETTLEESFQMLLNDINPEKKYTISLDIDKTITKTTFSREKQLNLYRILQEQVRNILKYANASAISVKLLAENNLLNLTIADDGKGFDVKNTTSGIGLSNIKRRAELFNGTMTIESAPGMGCSLFISIPFGMNNM